MAELRLARGSHPVRGDLGMRWLATWLCVLAGAPGCRASEAGPTSGLTPPPGWQALPSISGEARRAATAAGIVIEGSEAWGDPARGCHGAWIALRANPGPVERLADELVRSLSDEPALAGIALTDVVKPTSGVEPGVLSLAFERTAHRGRLRAAIARDGQVAMLACFWNQREPIACEAACSQLIASMR